MLKGNRKYYLVLAVIFAGVVVLYYSQPQPINWNRTYGKDDKIPFGCYAIFQLLEPYGQRIETNAQSLHSLNAGNQSANQSLLIIDSQLDMTSMEIASLLDFLHKGNTVFLCANKFGEPLRDTFHLNTEWNVNVNFSSLDSILKKPAFGISYVQKKNNLLPEYIYPKVGSESFFSRLDTNLFQVSAVNKKHMPVLLEAKIGKGKLLLSTLPDVFGNLFIVHHPNRFYVYTLLSKLKNEVVIWDEYYKFYGHPPESLFVFIFSDDALYMAYSVAMLALLLFMILGIKRKQRGIPVITPPSNATLEFVDVISQVYFKSSNHQHIVQETIRYFYFDISRKFNLSTAKLDDNFFTSLHHLSGVEPEKIRTLFNYCETLKQAPLLTERDLLELNDRITHFKQQSIR